MGLDNAKRVCRKCGIDKDIEEFSFIKNGGRRRHVCYKCNYGNRNHFYETASKEEILEHLKKRLMEKVTKTRGCWIWNGFVRPDGYTRMTYKVRGKAIGGHVISWMIHNEQIEVPTLNVLHRCDNRSCTNPNHLFLGTYRDNSIDMVLKKRHPGIKLAVDQVRTIKAKLADGVTMTRLAKDFGVNIATISDIKKGKTWKHVK